ncbi:AraC family transcriptional regulator [Psychroserpens sp.]|uniref:helix-turn-helix domain-containing protein n=1 Tax=Psychroserpens sp. TaxID=2020870 RepID=UPI001B09E0D2|nr:AraC family transcriptional regulator [Psychroserpens sp.]MBO6607634.1 helix-turn-helix transcriptional regulator [Psychroserpens sp.]MBO6631423.1 helix-turn-helix transcriptional regulator [Psychroserpens sp.]MBO6655054.1 helix-turn-helix transcriptional regulator [Psychroserpens sp.]MBO6683141.1 helix-turn-helix transcriptional regulator [Psychroserpens sp.]MBO6749680.1 helix-turn-helix transcriptional regulator [Psychroserpens sp.]
MTSYEEKLIRLKSKWFSNEHQIASIIKTRLYIDNNLHKNLNLDLLSEMRFTSKFHLHRLFKRYYGLTPKQYLTDRRIKKSKEYLINGMSVTETCYAVGFESLGSFSKLFKDKIGKSPSVFQKEQESRSLIATDS